MCGIAGILSKTNRPPNRDRLKQMVAKLRHRGPDAHNVWGNAQLGMGNTRLKILDLSDAGNQPFTDGKDVLVFNGRIFNHKFLKHRLANKYRFNTTCDTEVLFRSLQEWGEGALDKLDGQFAFAFFSLKENTLLIARDHIGICPLYLFENEDEFCFASEIKPLLINRRCRVSQAGLVDFLTYRYNIQNGKTLFEGITRFHPAHYLKIDISSKQRTLKRYWRFSFKESKRSTSTTQSEFNALLDKHIENQQETDVPVGMYLSGGIDSGALLSGYSKITNQVKTFTLKFAKKDIEHQRVLQLGKKYQFKMNIIDFSPRDLDSIRQAVLTIEDPFADLIITANLKLAEAASKKVRVVLTGEGGDEVLLGYDHQRVFLTFTKVCSFPPLKFLLIKALTYLPLKFWSKINPYPGKISQNELEKLLSVVKAIDDPARAYINLVTLFSKAELEKLINPTFISKLSIKPDQKPIEKIFAKDSQTWQSVIRAELEQLTMIVNLTKQDRFAMHFSMEGCVPLVSKEILEFIGTLPFGTIYGNPTKKLLLSYSKQKIIKKKPFIMATTKAYLKYIGKLSDWYLVKHNYKLLKIFNWQDLSKIKDSLNSDQILGVKKVMALITFAVWLEVFDPYLDV